MKLISFKCHGFPLDGAPDIAYEIILFVEQIPDAGALTRRLSLN
jgi:hypothetical protein